MGQAWVDKNLLYNYFDFHKIAKIFPMTTRWIFTSWTFPSFVLLFILTDSEQMDVMTLSGVPKICISSSAQSVAFSFLDGN